MTEQTALTLPQRAAVALDSANTETKLRELVTQSADLVEILNPAAREQIHRAAMNLKGMRVNIEKTGKEARDDATKFSKAVIQEEARLVAIIEPEESRLFGIRDKWDAKIEEEKQAKIAAERARVEAIQQRISDFGKFVSMAAGCNSEFIKGIIENLSECHITDELYAEFCDRANNAKDEAASALETAYKAAYDAEQAAEAARIKREEEDRQRAEEAARLEAQRKEQERVAAEQAAEKKRIIDAAAAHTAEIERKEREAKARVQAEIDAEMDRVNAAAAAHAVEMKRQADELAAKQKAFEDERAAEEERQIAVCRDIDHELALRMNAEHDAAKLEYDHMEALEMNAQWVAPKKLTGANVVVVIGGIECRPVIDPTAFDEADKEAGEYEPTDEEIIALYIDNFGGTQEQAIERLRKFSFDAINDE